MMVTQVVRLLLTNTNWTFADFHQWYRLPKAWTWVFAILSSRGTQKQEPKEKADVE